MTLYHQLVDQDLLAQFVDRKASRVEKMGVEAVIEACKIGISAGFKKCKQMAQAFLLNSSAENLKTNPSDGGLKVVMDDCVVAFNKISRWLPLQPKSMRLVARLLCGLPKIYPRLIMLQDSSRWLRPSFSTTVLKF